MQEALDRVKREMPPSIAESEILEYLAFALFKQGNIKQALITTDRLYEIAPSHPRAKGNIKWYEDQMKADGIKPIDMRRNIPPIVNPRAGDSLGNSERDIYEALCRDEVPVKEETKAFSDLGTGNRIATALFYLSKPDEGGFTVFTDLKSAMKPSKYDCLFWYNLLRSGEGDLRTRHAACPVLLGTKWIANKWIHEKKQEFLRPCALTPSVQERYVGDLGGPEPRFYPNISPYCKKGAYCE
uniref:Fe2OG dioxygenase domain-containing protein n=1 Tax=Meloidogyne javanica TaxID=6303 RepID=A0A915ML79_MELJA